MLNAKLSPPKPEPVPGNIIVAGRHCGIRILCTPGAYKTYKEVDALNKKGNHWARLIIKGIAALSSGRANLDNVFVKKGIGSMYAQRRGAFYVSLPGVLATFEDLDGTSYILTHFKADTSYFQHQQTATKPGLWRVNKSVDDWSAVYVKNGRLLPKHTHRHVAITDRGYKSPDVAARSAANALGKINGTIRDIIKNDGFDMHFTPGGKHIAGLLNLREAYMAEMAPSLRESAQLLANTMYHAKDMKSVYWYSDWGGSGVLTQAMQQLANQGVSLKQHGIIMSNPTTLPSVAQALARKLELSPVEGGKSGVRPKELVGRILYFNTPYAAIQRWRENKKEYSGKQLLLDGTKKVLGVGNFATSAVGFTATVGLLATGAPIAAVSGWIGALYFAGNLIVQLRKGGRS